MVLLPTIEEDMNRELVVGNLGAGWVRSELNNLYLYSTGAPQTVLNEAIISLPGPTARGDSIPAHLVYVGCFGVQ